MSLNKDLYEYNDNFSYATTLTANASTITNLTVHDRSDIDYYKITLTGTGMTSNFVKASFTNAKGNLNMKLYNASGVELASSTSTANSEQISLNGLAAGTYYVKVYGHEGDSNTYNLSWNKTNYAPKADSYEGSKGNNSIATATTLTAVKSSISGRTIHSGSDVDYYKITLTGVGLAANLVKATFTNATGNLDMTLYNASGAELASSTSTGNSEQISLKGLAAGTYYVKVYGAGGALNTYSLAWDKTNYAPKADSYEASTGNNSMATATTLTAVKSSVSARTIHNGSDVDYYKIILPNTGTAANLVKATFTHASGNLDMALYDASGVELASSTSAGNSEQISLNGLAAGTYYVKVYGVNGALNTYSLSWDKTNYGPKADSYEGTKGNNSMAAATALAVAKSSVSGRTIHSGSDVDYYKITLPGTGTAANLVKATFTNASGNLDMTLYDASGVELASSASTGNSEEISLKGLAAGSYYVKVYGANQALNTYTLNWDSSNYGPKGDSYEGTGGNNSITAATMLTAVKGSANGCSIHIDSDVDYYKIILTGTGTAANYFKATSINVTGNLDMKLYDASGTELRPSSSAADSKQISLKGLAAGTYYAMVSGVDGETNAYNLSWDRTNYAPKADSYEGTKGNNSIATATALTANKSSVSDRSIHSGSDVDYYKIILTGEGMAANYFKAASINATGTLDVKLYNAAGTELLSSNSAADSAQISLKGLAAGTYYATVSGVDGAIGTYALAWDKTNYAPPADSYESAKGNNSIATATTLTALKSSAASRSIHNSGDVDYYKITLTGIGLAANVVKVTFTNAKGNLDMQLYDASGAELRSSTSTADSEQISLKGLAAGTYYVKVYGNNGALNSYTLTWDKTNYAPKVDSYESAGGNNSIATATTLTAAKSSVSSRSIHNPDDVDYYKVILPNTGTAANLVKATFTNATGNLDMKLYDASGAELASSTSTANSEQISLKGLSAGTYYVKVYGVNGALNTYTLNWDRTNYGPKGDSYEGTGGNNSIATATTLTAAKSSVTARTIHNTVDVDYYRITLAGTGMAANLVTATFTNATGNLDMKLYDASGAELRSSASTGNSEQISLKGLAAGTYYVKVYGVDGALNTYSLAWDKTNYAPKVDYYEGAKGNNSIATATTLPYANGWTSGYTTIHSGTDVDYFKLTLTGRGTAANYFKATAINATGTLDMKLYNASGTELRSSTATADSRQINLLGLAAGTYYVKMDGADGALGTYNLAWDYRCYLPSLANRTDNYVSSADKYENNDSISSAATILTRASSVDNLTIHSGSDVDHYKITLTATGSSANYIKAFFTHSSGNLDMKLYDAAGNELRSSSSVLDSERISLQGLAADSYYLKVYGVNSALNTYSLAWDRADYTMPAPGISTAATLVAAGNSLSNATLDQTKDVNYYTFTLASLGTASDHITINSITNLHLSLLDSGGRVLYTTDSQAKIKLSGLASGTYHLQVRDEDMITGGDAIHYSIDYDIKGSSAATEKRVGTEYSSLFSINAAQAEYAYLMGFGNITRADFTSSSYPSTRMSYSNPLFFDAEKSTSNTRDNNQCWAATASNMLAWSGWGNKGISSATGNSAEDVIFSQYSKSFPDTAGTIEDGVRWFFEKNYKNYSNSLTASTGSGNYLGTSVLNGLTVNKITGAESLQFMAEALDNNMAVGLMMGYYSSASSTARSGGHAITVWGYTFDITKAQNAPGYYTGLLVTDSDDSKTVSVATAAADTLNMISIAWDNTTKTYYTKYDAGSKVAKLETFITLDHYSTWPATQASMASAPATSSALLGGDGNTLDSLLASAVQPSADTMRAASELTYGNDKYKQNGLLTA